MRALQISAYGDPLNVLELVDVPEPDAPGEGEVLIDVELAPLNKHDLLFIHGFFGGPPTPTVVGNEGFGRVTAVGPGVANVKVGEHVLEHVVFFRNRDSQLGEFLIQAPCWGTGASMDDATLFGRHSRTCSGAG